MERFRRDRNWPASVRTALSAINKASYPHEKLTIGNHFTGFASNSMPINVGKRLFTARGSKVDEVSKDNRTFAKLADLYQNIRSPRHETFAGVFTDEKGVIVHEFFNTSLDVKSVYIPMDIVEEEAKKAMAKGASRMYMMHNHPSSSVNASRADLAVTERIAGMLAALQAMLLVDWSGPQLRMCGMSV